MSAAPFLAFRVIWVTAPPAACCSVWRFGRFANAWRCFQKLVRGHATGRVQIQHAVPEHIPLGVLGQTMYDGEPVVRPVWRVLVDHRGPDRVLVVGGVMHAASAAPGAQMTFQWAAR